MGNPFKNYVFINYNKLLVFCYVRHCSSCKFSTKGVEKSTKQGTVLTNWMICLVPCRAVTGFVTLGVEQLHSHIFK